MAEGFVSFCRNVLNGVSNLLGVDPPKQYLRLKELFCHIFKRKEHPKLENLMTVGTDATTPEIGQIDASPRPWLYAYVMGALYLIALFFYALSTEYTNPNCVPGMFFVGSFAVPVGIVLLFFELNVARNISFFRVLSLIMWGGVLSLMAALVLFDSAKEWDVTWLGASLAGPVEEPAKIIVLLLVLRKQRYPYVLNGLLFGAAVGAGFAAFESAGYAFQFGFGAFQQAAQQGSAGFGPFVAMVEAMWDIMTLRATLAPFMHVGWTAMCGGMLWYIKGSQPFKWQMFTDGRFLRVVGIAILLHMIWNSKYPNQLPGSYAILGLTVWLVLWVLISKGIEQVRDMQTTAEQKNLLNPDAANADTKEVPESV